MVPRPDPFGGAEQCSDAGSRAGAMVALSVNTHLLFFRTDEVPKRYPYRHSLRNSEIVIGGRLTDPEFRSKAGASNIRAGSAMLRALGRK
jgi:hypothetical protein